METSLKAFYKKEIKTLAREIKERKPLVRSLESLGARGLGETEEYKIKLEKLPKWYGQGHLSYDRVHMRKLYLSYAVIRGKDISKVEKTPPPLEFYEQTMKKMEVLFAAQTEPLKEIANG